MKKCPYCAEDIQDAAVVCRFCNRELAQVAAEPAVPVPAKAKAGIGTMLVWLILAAGGLALVSAMFSNGSSTAAPSKTLGVKVQFSALALEVMNTSAPAGQELIVYINGTPPFTYKAVATMPEIGKVVRIPLTAFTKKDGTRFNPMATAVTVAWVGGGGYDYSSISR